MAGELSCGKVRISVNIPLELMRKIVTTYGKDGDKWQVSQSCLRALEAACVSSVFTESDRKAVEKQIIANYKRRMAKRQKKKGSK